MSQLVDEIVASAGTTSSGVLGNSIDMEKNIYNAVYNATLSAINNSDKDTNVSVRLEGDAKGLFKLTRDEAHQYYKRTGNNAFEKQYRKLD